MARPNQYSSEKRRRELDKKKKKEEKLKLRAERKLLGIVDGDEPSDDDTAEASADESEGAGDNESPDVPRES